MKKIVFVYGLALTALILALKWMEYQFFVKSISIEFYLFGIALIFLLVGLRIGNRIKGKKEHTRKLEWQSGTENIPELTKREMEVLVWMAKGKSNQEIAEALYISLSTVKTHTSKVYQKLEVKRRTQAIEKARSLGLIVQKNTPTKVSNSKTIL